ncbi:MAG: hypothetical protein ACE5F1_16970 [Planctomycetota bacterium]
MILGQVLIAAQNITTHYYSPWFPRGGNAARMASQVIADDGLDSFKITVETKNTTSDDAAALELVTAQAITLGTPYTITDFDAGDDVDGTGAGMLELVRFKYIVKGGANAFGWVHFRMLAPQWLTNGA